MSRLVSRLVIALLLTVVCADAATVTVAVHGVVRASDLPPEAANWFALNQPDVFRRMVLGRVTIETALALGASPVHQAELIPTVQRDGAGWVIDGYRVRRVLRGGDQQPAVLADHSRSSEPPALTAAALDLAAYRLRRELEPPAAQLIAFGDGFIFPSAADATAFRWTSATPRLPAILEGTPAPGWLRAGGVRIARGDAGALIPLGDIAGAWVQVRNTATGAYLYVRQRAMTHADPATYDPLRYDGELILAAATRPEPGPPPTSSTSSARRASSRASTSVMACRSLAFRSIWRSTCRMASRRNATA